ncbi:hypothetical protein K492DRAFT_172486 [Lichtheimia hyalospora FSU 10163]|nr:hypothetical protein K492DRAFT_172486 [Lichtheimia hyalospora FSU 10163]
MPSFFTPSSKASAPSYEAISSDDNSYPSGPAAEIPPPPPYTSYAAPSPQIQPPHQYQYAPPSPPLQPTTLQPVAAYGAVPGPTINNLISLRDEPGYVQCPHCGHHVETVTEHQNGSASVFSAVVLFLFGCHSGGCLIPFCLPMCQDVTHACPACQMPIATFSRLSQHAVLE